jgi:hypothetical protein
VRALGQLPARVALRFWQATPIILADTQAANTTLALRAVTIIAAVIGGNACPVAVLLVKIADGFTAVVDAISHAETTDAPVVVRGAVSTDAALVRLETLPVAQTGANRTGIDGR